MKWLIYFISHIKDVESRWNSTFYSIESVLDQQKVLEHVSIEFNGCAAIKKIDFQLLRKIKAVLSPFEKITKKLSHRNESISSVLPAYHSLIHTLQPMDFSSDMQEDADLHVEIESFKLTIMNGLAERMKNFLKERFYY